MFALVSVSTALPAALTSLHIIKVFCHGQMGKMLNVNSLCGINNVGKFIYFLQLTQACGRMGLEHRKTIKGEEAPCGR